MASLQSIVEQLALLAAERDNATTPHAPFSGVSAHRELLEIVTSTVQMLFSASALRNWAILLVIGSVFETARRLLRSLWDYLVNAFFITAFFQAGDPCFDWMMHWLSKHPSWREVRKLDVTTRKSNLSTELDYDSGDVKTDGRKIAYIPAVSESFGLWYKHHRLRVARRVGGEDGWSGEMLTMSILTRDRSVLAEILQEARTQYIEAQEGKISIYTDDGDSDWYWLATRPKRPIKSVILDPGTTELLLEDIRDFLDSKMWYAERGIPFRRGYLLYGVPGSGKTSLIQSIAGELGLDVYILSLSRSKLDDTTLSALISNLPERCIVLMEDIDAAFYHGLNREDSEESNGAKPQNVPYSNGVSLSGLLNALDGIGAQEGRVLFATTNKYDSLDPALCRPGRMDLHIKFSYASRSQAEELFMRFYTLSVTNGHAAKVSEDALAGDLIDLSQAPPSEKGESSVTTTDRPHYVGTMHSHRGPAMSQDRIRVLAAQFALAVPERQFSMASLQGFLMMYKTRPVEAVEAIGAWVEKELGEREPGE